MQPITSYERFGLSVFNPALFRDFTPEISDLLRLTGQMLDKMSNLFGGSGFPFDRVGGDGGNRCPGFDIMPLDPPRCGDSTHPSGSLKVEGNVVTTAGGYKIEQLGQFDWRITGPDGKETKIWGDPHVAEGDGGKWDFKNNSTFVLGDGTVINVTTAPFSGNKDMTVTQGLEIICGNDRVEVTGIDQGMGKIGTVTQDGYAHRNCFSGKDVFVMGRESDDWSKEGREIIGSENGGETFKLGGQLAPPDSFRNADDYARALLDEILRRTGGSDIRPLPFERGNPFQNIREGGCDHRPSPAERRETLSQLLRMMSRMLRMMSRLFDMNDHIALRRNPFRLYGATV